MISKGYNQINLRLSCDKIMFFDHQKVPKIPSACYYSEGGLCWLKDFPLASFGSHYYCSLVWKNRQNQINDCKINDVFLWQNNNDFHSLSSKSRNSKMFAHSDFKMALSFAIIGSIATNALKFIDNSRT